MRISELNQKIKDGTITEQEMLAAILDRIGSWTTARWDQWARYEFGDELTNKLIKWLESLNVNPSRR